MITDCNTFANAANGGFVLDTDGEFIVRPATVKDYKPDGTPIGRVVSLRQTGGGKPSASYTADAMANDLDGPRAVVVVYHDHVEKWVG